MDQPIQNAVGQRGIADLRMPLRHRQLAGQQRRPGQVALIADLQECPPFSIGHPASGVLSPLHPLHSGSPWGSSLGRLPRIGSSDGDCAPPPSHTTGRAVFRIRRLNPAASSRGKIRWKRRSHSIDTRCSLVAFHRPRASRQFSSATTASISFSYIALRRKVRGAPASSRRRGLAAPLGPPEAAR